MSPEEITAAFATAAAAFTPIVGQPNDDDLTRLRDTIYLLLLNIPYDNEPPVAGVFCHNLIGLIKPTLSYTAQWHQAFPWPNQPLAYPTIDNNASSVIQARSKAKHARIVRDYKSFDAAERAVSKFIRNAVEEVWYKDLKDVCLFYTNVTAKELIDHLNDNCGGLHSSEVVHGGRNPQVHQHARGSSTKIRLGQTSNLRQTATCHCCHRRFGFESLPTPYR